MAGLTAAARLRELGREVLVLEKGTRPGGSMLLSSGVFWRHRELEDFHAECPGGDRVLQALVWERLDDALGWLESLGAPVLAGETGNARTIGARFDPRGLTDALVQASGGLCVDPTQAGIRLSTALPSGAKGACVDPTQGALRRASAVDPDGDVVLATGGFGVRLARERGLSVRAAPWSEGDGIAFAQHRGAALSVGQDEFYGRAMPAPPAAWGEQDFVRAAQLYGRFARVLDDEGRPVFDGELAWHENDLAQALASVPDAWLVVDDRDLGARVRERTVADMIRVAEELGAKVRRDAGTTAVRVRAAVTHTLGGLRIDTRARVLDEDGDAIPGLYAAGVDAGGVFTGGYGSGLAAALVLGLAAAEDL